MARRAYFGLLLSLLIGCRGETVDDASDVDASTADVVTDGASGDSVATDGAVDDSVATADTGSDGRAFDDSATVADSRTPDAVGSDTRVGDALSDSTALVDAPDSISPDVRDSQSSDTADGASVSDARDAAPLDSGCNATSCSTKTCGPSSCGYVCGICTGTNVCTVSGACGADCPGTGCTDHWGATACYGTRSFRTCPTDATKVQLCNCSAGTWSACDLTCLAEPCEGCVAAKCKTAYTQCQGFPTCKSYYECYVACGSTACQQQCFTTFTSDTSDQMRSCLTTSCAASCPR